MDWQASLAWFSRRSDPGLEPVNEDDCDYPPAFVGFGTPPPTPTESDFGWPTRSSQTDDDIDVSFFDVDDLPFHDPSYGQSSLWACAAFTASDAADIEGPQDVEPAAAVVEACERRILTPEQAAELALLNAAAETAAEEATQALNVALASTGNLEDNNFDNFMSLVENACVLKGHATALKAIAEAAAERILAAQLFA